MAKQQKKKGQKRQQQTKKEAPKKGVKNIRLIHCIGLFVLGFAIYSNTLDHRFVLDDSLFITGNKYTAQGYEGIKQIWANDAFVGAHGRAFDLEGGRYRPLSISIFALQYEWFGPAKGLRVGSPEYNKGMVSLRKAGHFFNVFLFACSGVLLYLLLVRLFDGNEWLPLIASALFVVHPIHTEVVANIKSLDEIMAVMWLIATIWLLLKGKGKWGVLAAVAYFFALLSKESTITALAIIPLTFWYFKGIHWKESLKSMIPIFISTALYIVMRERFSAGFGSGLEAVNPMDSPYIFASLAEKYASITYVLGKYLALLFWPNPLSYDYSYQALPIVGWSNIWALLSFLAYAGMIFFAIKTFKQRNLIGFGFLFFICAISIVSNIVFNIGAPMGERFDYMPSIGICIAVAALIVHFLKLKEGAFQWKPAAVGVLLLFVALGSYGTMQRNKAWFDNFTLYETDIEVASKSARATMFYGIELINKHWDSNFEDDALMDEAVQYLTKSTEIYPQWHHSWYNLGLAYLTKNELQKAMECFNTTLSLQPTHINGTFKSGECMVRANTNFDEGIARMEKAVEWGYDSPERFISLATAWGMKGDYPKALDYFNKALVENPNSASLYLNLGITYQQMGDEAKAQQHFDRAFELNPSLRQAGQ